MQLYEKAEQIRTREDLAGFMLALREDLVERSDTWENGTLERFLSTLSAWTEDMDGYFINRGEPVPTQPTWKTVALMLLAAKGYE